MALLNPDPAPEDQAPGPTTPAGGSFKNPLLAQVEAKLEAGLTPANKPDYMKIVVSGMKIVTGGGAQGLIQKLANSQTPLKTAVNGSINLVAYMSHAAKGKMPPKAMVPAAMTLMLHALDFLDRTGKLPVDENVVVQATHMFADSVMQAFNITQEKLQQMAQQAHGVTQNPQQLQAVQQHASKFKPPYQT